MLSDASEVSVILPARNEERAIGETLDQILTLLPGCEVIVVDDASEDGTADIAEARGARVITQPYRKGNGAAIKTGARAASRSVLVFMDADGQHRPQYISDLLQALDDGYDMAVGARDGDSQAGIGRSIANRLYNWLASYMVGHTIRDLTSGFRAVRTDKFREFIHLLPNGFSYPTTITMAFFRAGYSVQYCSISCPARLGESHLNPWREGVRFLLIIFRVATLYSPLKMFFPLAAMHAVLGVGYYLYTFLTIGRFTNMSALLMSSAVEIFLIGLVSEQIANLYYQNRN